MSGPAQPSIPIRDLGAEVDLDVDRWESMLAVEHGVPRGYHPEPRKDHGLPEGWTIWATFASAFSVSVALVQRLGGDWLIVEHEESIQKSTIAVGHETLTGLYRQVCHHRDDARLHRGVDAFYFEVAEWLYAVIWSMYDDGDAEEVSERMLFSMGATTAAPPHVSRFVP